VKRVRTPKGAVLGFWGSATYIVRRHCYGTLGRLRIRLDHALQGLQKLVDPEDLPF